MAAARLYVVNTTTRLPLRGFRITKTPVDTEPLRYTWGMESMEGTDSTEGTESGEREDDAVSLNTGLMMFPDTVLTKEGHSIRVVLPESDSTITINDRTLILYSMRNMFDREYLDNLLEESSDDPEVYRIISPPTLQTNRFQFLGKIPERWSQLMNTQYTTALSTPAPILDLGMQLATEQTFEKIRDVTEGMSDSELMSTFLSALNGDGEGTSSLIPYQFVFETDHRQLSLTTILTDHPDYTLVAAFYAEGDGVNSLWFDRMDGSHFVPTKIHIAVLRHVMVNDELLVQPSTLRELRLRKLREPEEEGEDETAKLDRILLLLSETAMYSQMCRHRYSTTTTKG
jgi:hypothetical protein